MSEIVREIESQPHVWAKAIERASACAHLLPTRGARTAVVGCGTSLFVAQAYSALRESAGIGETDAFAASEAPTDRSYETVVVISRSGTTTEVVRLLEALPQVTRTVAICGVSGTPVSRAANDTVVLEFADERSVVQTRFATSTLVMLRSSLGETLEMALDDGQRAIEIDLPIEPSEFDHFVFLGRGWTVGLANEAALKLREASGAWTESYPAMEFRHGPISAAGARTVVWTIGDVDETLAADAEATGATVVSGRLDPLAELILIQRTAVALAEHNGLDPDHPQHLTRSVVLS